MSGGKTTNVLDDKHIEWNCKKKKNKEGFEFVYKSKLGFEIGKPHSTECMDNK